MVGNKESVLLISKDAVSHQFVRFVNDMGEVGRIHVSDVRAEEERFECHTESVDLRIEGPSIDLVVGFAAKVEIAERVDRGPLYEWRQYGEKPL